jgi:hypothetical protein
VRSFLDPKSTAGPPAKGGPAVKKKPVASPAGSASTLMRKGVGGVRRDLRPGAAPRGPEPEGGPPGADPAGGSCEDWSRVMPRPSNFTVGGRDCDFLSPPAPRVLGNGRSLRLLKLAACKELLALDTGCQKDEDLQPHNMLERPPAQHGNIRISSQPKETLP